MKLHHGLAIAACSLGLIQQQARGADTEPSNPPRSQQEIMKERYAACRDLHGSALKECMANYVGPDKNLQRDGEVREDPTSMPSAPPRPPQNVDPAQGGAPKG